MFKWCAIVVETIVIAYCVLLVCCSRWLIVPAILGVMVFIREVIQWAGA